MTREHRIHYEIIVDAYDEYEQAMGWYIHTNDNLAFPMQAKVKLRLRGGKTEEKTVKIVEVDPKSETSLTLRLGMTPSARGQKRPCAVHQPRRHRAYQHVGGEFGVFE